MALGTAERRPGAQPRRTGWLSLVGWVALCLAVGGVGGAWTSTSVSTWYPTLQKPSWNPPAFVFGPVWTTLYVLMGTAAWRIWRGGGSREVRIPVGAFLAQLVLNLAWSGLFFGLRQPALAFAEVLLLWCSILITLVLFARRDLIAAWLLAPYLAWVTVAAALNGAIWLMNRG